MPYKVTATFQSSNYVACFTRFDQPFKSQIDVAGIGFRPDDGNHFVVLFPTADAATAWGTIWFKRNKRVKPGLSKSFFDMSEVTLT